MLLQKRRYEERLGLHGIVPACTTSLIYYVTSRELNLPIILLSIGILRHVFPKGAVTGCIYHDVLRAKQYAYKIFFPLSLGTYECLQMGESWASFTLDFRMAPVGIFLAPHLWGSSALSVKMLYGTKGDRRNLLAYFTSTI